MRPSALAAGAAALTCVLARAGDAHAQCRGRPTDPAGFQGYSYGAALVKSYVTERVRVHYATTGTHAPNQMTTRGDGVPDIVVVAADAGQTALSKYSEMGFKNPPGDGACASNGGDDKLDIYLVAFAGADGTAVPEACNGRVCSTFMLVESSFLGRGYPSVEEGFRTVVTHELFHAVQNAYDQDIDRFWAEGTAQWAMKSVFPELVDFERQLPAYFKDNTRSLDTQPSGVTAGYLYGSAVWPLFLTLHHGADTVRQIFEAEADGTKAIAATEKVLAAKGASMADTYPLFGAWNAATKGLAGVGGYPDAAKYPGVKLEELADGVSGITAGLGYFVYRGTLGSSSKVSLETDATRNAGVAVPLEAGKPNLDKATPLPANLQGDVLVVVAGITTKKTDAPFTVRIGAADAPSSSSGGVDEAGGCTTSPSRSAHATNAASALPVAALALVAAGARALRRRRR